MGRMRPETNLESVTQHSRDTPQFYLTAPSPCPYLPGKEERKVFTHLVGERAHGLNDLLTHGGFRRSQSIAYRPACEACRACVSVRVIADEFRPTKSMKRVAERNEDIIGEMRALVPTSEQYSVFRAYLDSRHRDGGMADMTVLDYAMMVEDSHVKTRLVEYGKPPPNDPVSSLNTGRPMRLRTTKATTTSAMWVLAVLSMRYSSFSPTSAEATRAARPNSLLAAASRSWPSMARTSSSSSEMDIKLPADGRGAL